MTLQQVGKNAQRIDAPAKVTGKALYPGDISYPDMLYMATLFAGRPHSRILAIDTKAAEAAPGVVAVFTARDVPVNEYGLQINDQPVLCGPGSEKAGADVVRFTGDQAALVIAESEAQARAALELIDVQWQDLPLLLDPEEAMQPGAYPLHPHCVDNVAYSYHIRHGDAEAALQAADVVVEGVYQTPVQEHAYLQPEAGVAYIDEAGRVTVEVAGQWTHADQKQIAHALDLPAGTGTGYLSGHRRRLRRPRRHVGPDHPGAGRLATGAARHSPPGQDHLEPRGIHRRARQTPRHEDLDPLGRPA